MSGGLPSLSSYLTGSSYKPSYTVKDPFAAARARTKTAKYNAAAKAAAAKEAGHGGGGILGDVTGVVGNLLGDAKDMATGAIPGTIKTVDQLAHGNTAPLSAIANDYKTRYGRILHGDFSDVYAHPLSYILDAATVASGGLGAVGKVGQIAKVADAAEAGSRVAKIANDLGRARYTKIGLKRGAPKTLDVALSPRPFVQMRQRSLLRLQSAPGVEKIPVFGLQAKARRTEIGAQRAAEAAFRKTQPAYDRSIKRLTTAPMLHVFDAVSRGTSPERELSFYSHHSVIDHLSPESKDLIGNFQHPHVQALYDEVTTHLKNGKGNPYLRSTKHLSKEAQHIVEALKQHKRLTDSAAHMLVKAGKYTTEQMAERRVAHLRFQDEQHMADLEDEIKHLHGVHSEAVDRASRLVAGDRQVQDAAALVNAARVGKLATHMDEASMAKESAKLGRRIEKAHAKVDDLVMDHPMVKAAVANVALLHVLRSSHNTQLTDLVKDNFLPGIAHNIKDAKHLSETVIPKAQQSVLDIADQVRSSLEQEHVHPIQDRQGLIDMLRADHKNLPDSAIEEAGRHLERVTQRVHGELHGRFVAPVEQSIKDAQDRLDKLRGPKNMKTGEYHKPAADFMAEAKARTGILPQYTADKMVLADTGNGEFSGKLYKTGNRQPNPELALVRHEQAANIASLQRAHEVLRQTGIPRPDGVLKKGEVWVRQTSPTHDYIGVNSERFGKEIQPIIESAKAVVAKEQGIDPRKMFFESMTQDFPPGNVEDRIAVPKVLAQDMVDRHLRTLGTMSEMLNKATHLWKGAVLAIRPGFITNNVLGNQTLYHLRNGFGPRALAALTAMKRDKAAFEDYFNEHNQTFGHAERFNTQSKIGKAVTLNNLGYRVVGQHELMLRTATMRRHAFKIPEFRKEYKALKGGKFDPAQHGGRNMFHEAMRRTIAKSPAVRDEITRVIDDTMGNYRYFNKFEEGMRQLVPFYSWNRHAVRSFERLLVDRPVLAQAIVEMSHTGNAEHNKDFPGTPDFMKSYLPFHHLGMNAVDTRALNPMLAATDTVDAVKQATQEKPGHLDKLAGIINPFIMDAIQSGTGTNLTTGAPLPHSSLDSLPAGKIIGQLLNGLPETRVASHLAGTDAPDKSSLRYQLTPTGRPAKHKPHMLSHSNTDLLAGFLGIPLKDVNLKAAQTYEKKLETQNQPHFHTATPRAKKKRIKF